MQGGVEDDYGLMCTNMLKIRLWYNCYFYIFLHTCNRPLPSDNVLCMSYPRHFSVNSFVHSSIRMLMAAARLKTHRTTESELEEKTFAFINADRKFLGYCNDLRKSLNICLGGFKPRSKTECRDSHNLAYLPCFFGTLITFSIEGDV